MKTLKRIAPHNIVIAGIIILILFIEIIGKPFFIHRDAKKTILSILNNWEGGGDVLKSIEYWEDPDLYRPFYGVTGYRFLKSKIYKLKNRKHAYFTIVIFFSDDNIYPSGSNWIFKLIETEFGWRVHDFYTIGNKLIDEKTKKETE
ncbi:MAG: hypothetical protein K8S27_14360 [Candidatus Omnitrophica bacterium]|nr:hypothetical protein [Candidatus Omnitrophota bacterium]